MKISIKLTNEEQQLANSYAKLHGLSLNDAFKKALFEKIEDEYDLAVAQDAFQDYVESGNKSRPIEDFWRELDEE